MKSGLRLRREVLAELSADALRRVGAAAPEGPALHTLPCPSRPCFVSLPTQQVDSFCVCTV